MTAPTALLVRCALSGAGLLTESGEGLRRPVPSAWAKRRDTLPASVWMALCRGLGLGDTDSSGLKKPATPQDLSD